MLMNKYLVFSSISNSSIHQKWLEVENRLFDVVLAYYGDDSNYFINLEKLNSDTFHVYRNKGLKWPIFTNYVNSFDVSKYRYIWIPDDNIELSGDKINEMFLTLEKNPNIKFAGPSTNDDSVDGAYRKRIDEHNCTYQLQYRTLLENDSICIHTDMLKNAMFKRILKSTYTGYYFDLLIKYCFPLNERKTTQAVLHNIIARRLKRTNNKSIFAQINLRKKNPGDITRFINNGFTRDMLKWSLEDGETIKHTVKCTRCIDSIKHKNIVDKLKDLKNILKSGSIKIPHLSKTNYIETDKIRQMEKNIHFIWIGSKIPDKYIDNIKTYLHNYLYTIYLWIDTNSIDVKIDNVCIKHIDELNFTNKDIFLKETNYGAKADILRYEIVYNYGGIYCDVDSVSLKPFDSNFSYSFLAYTPGSYKNVTNAVFGFEKESKFLKYVIDTLTVHYSPDIGFIPSRTGPTFLTSCLLAYDNDQQNIIDQKYLIFNTEHSYTYHTMDANWMKKK